MFSCLQEETEFSALQCSIENVGLIYWLAQTFYARIVVKGVEHISTNVLVNIWVVRVRVLLVLSVGIWICKNSIINT